MIDSTEVEAQIRERVHGPEDGEAFRKAVAAKGGFKRKPKIYRLDFTDTALDGLTVRAHSAPIGLFMQLGTLADELEGSDDNTDTGMTAMLRTIQELVDLFAQVLVSWDLVDDDDQPVPATAAGLLTLDVEELMFIITAWQNAVAAVAPPLPDASNAGSPSLAVSMPMEPLSASQAS
jgi:hypothetical protein